MAKDTAITYRNCMIYSVYVRNYGVNGTFSDVEKDLDRIRSLGTDIIWFMPIHPIGQTGRKGNAGSPYAIRDYRDINPEYGSMDDFLHLTEEIHRLGMKCIIDVVYNHTSPDSVLAKEHPEWFRLDENGKPSARVKEWYDIVDLDYTNEPLWDYLIETLCYWAQYVDGFRCDVAPMIPLEFWMKARKAVAAVRPDAFWLAESGEDMFVRMLRKDSGYCLSDPQLYQAFDALYDYDVYPEWKAFACEGASLQSYLDRLNLQEIIYPANYIKMHFLENHDQPRLAAMIPDPGLRRHTLAFSAFQKGLFFIYNGQERSDPERPDLFDRDPVNWSGTDLSDVIIRMMSIKRREIFAEGSFYAQQIRPGLVQASYSSKGKSVLGFFRLGVSRSVSAKVSMALSGPSFENMEASLPDGIYRNEYNGEDIHVFHGIIPVGADPVVISLGHS